MGNAVVVSSQTFESEVLKSPVPVLVDFWAPWCGPCRAVGPVVDQIAAEYTGKLKVVKVNTDENEAVSIQYQVMSIPTLILFKDGKVHAQKVGALSKSQLAAFVDSNL